MRLRGRRHINDRGRGRNCGTRVPTRTVQSAVRPLPSTLRARSSVAAARFLIEVVAVHGNGSGSGRTLAPVAGSNAAACRSGRA